MPQISLIVCLCGERELLERLLQHSQQCYDELLVIHDGPDEKNIQGLVDRYNGKLFEMPRAYQQERHWKFAFGTAKHDWILKMDSDEFPSPALRDWLQAFRSAPEPENSVAGYLCIWPMWNGKKAVTQDWPDNRQLLFHRQRVCFFGMPECAPVSDLGTTFQNLPLVLEHQPAFSRKTYGFLNFLFRKRSWEWAREIAFSLRDSPLDLPCWRWTDPEWPPFWESMRQHPLRTGVWGGLRKMLGLLVFSQPHPNWDCRCLG